MSKGNSPFQTSPDLYTSGIIWNDVNLLKYMKNPQQFVESHIGMTFKGLSNLQERGRYCTLLKNIDL
ncbi:hypothetical protein PFDG_03695 [Plasmodium falciparum Dd2]|uniref:Uncharacterized protein n=1 Tax=Plasmodium falciparum (isolate Dd2) TaxID=57267 RepID=A0A0L7M455_PLAF4|nr:hypothetical protein PFDG_03695 [Plasmodium falciparum Dd2]